MADADIQEVNNLQAGIKLIDPEGHKDFLFGKGKISDGLATALVAYANLPKNPEDDLLEQAHNTVLDNLKSDLPNLHEAYDKLSADVDSFIASYQDVDFTVEGSEQQLLTALRSYAALKDMYTNIGEFVYAANLVDGNEHTEKLADFIYDNIDPLYKEQLDFFKEKLATACMSNPNFIETVVANEPELAAFQAFLRQNALEAMFAPPPESSLQEEDGISADINDGDSSSAEEEQEDPRASAAEDIQNGINDMLIYIDGESLSLSNVIYHRLRSSNAGQREQAAQAAGESLKQFMDETYAPKIYQYAALRLEEIGEQIDNARGNGWQIDGDDGTNPVLQYAALMNDVTVANLQELDDSIQNASGNISSYFRAKAQLLHGEEVADDAQVNFADLSANFPKSDELQFSWQEAREIIIATFGDVSPEAAKFVEQELNTIQGGALTSHFNFSSDSSASPTPVSISFGADLPGIVSANVLNDDGTISIENLGLLIHEMTHLCAYNFCKQNALQYDPNSLVEELPTGTVERLYYRHAQAKLMEKATGKPEAQSQMIELYFASKDIEDTIMNLQMDAAFFAFEQKLYEFAAEHADDSDYTPQSDEIRNLYIEAFESVFGNCFEHSDLFKNYLAQYDHILDEIDKPFYNFQYPVAKMMGLYLMNQMDEKTISQEQIGEGLMNIFEAGGSTPFFELVAKSFGLEQPILSSDFYKQALALQAKKITKFVADAKKVDLDELSQSRTDDDTSSPRWNRNKVESRGGDWVSSSRNGRNDGTKLPSF